MKYLSTSYRPFIRSLFFCLAGLLVSWSVQADEPTIILGANESPPYWSATLKDNGMAGEILAAISQVIGLNSVIEFKPLKRLIEDEDNNDLGNPIFYLPQQEFSSIIPIAIYYNAFFSYKSKHQHSSPITHLEEFKDHSIGLLKGTLTDHAYFNKMGIKFEESYSRASLFKKLKLGRIDICVEIGLVGKQTIADLFPDEVDQFDIMMIANSAAPIAIMIDDDYPNGEALGALYRQGLAQIIESGRYLQILEKYYGADAVPENWLEKLQHYQALYYFEDTE